MGNAIDTSESNEKKEQELENISSTAVQPEAIGDIESVEINFAQGDCAGITQISFYQDWFKADSDLYNHNLCQLCSQFIMIGYDTEVKDPEKQTGFEYTKVAVKTALEAIGMKDIIINPQTEYDQVNFFIANRKINVAHKEYTLVFTGMIGSHYEQWYSNFDSDMGRVHKGFNNARYYVFEKLRKYIEALNTNRRDVKLLITGHSRGAAAANLLAAQMISEEIYAKKENIFAYTFATPNPTMLSERNDLKYNRIYNIVNPEDFVTYCMPELWGFGRYGTTLALPNKDNVENFSKYLKNMNAYFYNFYDHKKYVPFKNGQKTVNKLVESIYSEATTVEEFYEKPLMCLGTETTIQQFFSQTLCAIVGEREGSSLSDKGTKILLNTFMKRRDTSPAIKAIADFFVLYEGIGSKTTGTISDTYFSFAHCAHTYCAFTLSITEEELMSVQKNDVHEEDEEKEEPKPNVIKSLFKKVFKK